MQRLRLEGDLIQHLRKPKRDAYDGHGLDFRRGLRS